MSNSLNRPLYLVFLKRGRYEVVNIETSVIQSVWTNKNEARHVAAQLNKHYDRLRVEAARRADELQERAAASDSDK